MRKLIIVSVAVIMILVACSKKVVPATAETPAAQPQQEEKTTMPAEPVQSQVAMKLDVAAMQGQSVYTAKCGRCHTLKNTGDYTWDQWENILKKMIPNAKLNDTEKDQVTAYVKANAKK